MHQYGKSYFRTSIFCDNIVVQTKPSVDVQLNHVMKTRDLVTKNNEKLQRQQTALAENGKKGVDFIDPPRDQGFTRPKVMH